MRISEPKGADFFMAHKLRPSTEAYNARVSLCDDRNWFESVCIKHGVFQSRRSNSVTVASHRLSTTTKETIFPSELGFVG